MHHVGGIEAIVTQVVNHYLKSREIIYLSLKCTHHAVNRQAQRRLAKQVGFKSVGNVSDWAYRENHVQLVVKLQQAVHHSGHNRCHLVNGCHFARKVVLRHFVAVCHHHGVLAQTVYNGCAERDDDEFALLEMCMGLRYAAVHAVECGLLVAHRVARMKRIAIPHAVGLKQVSASNRLTAYDAVN